MFHFFFNLILFLFKKILIYLGPIYIKLGQLLSYDYPIFKNLQTLQNKCPGLNSKEISYFQSKYPNLNISNHCFAAGSVSVVHTGFIENTVVAIKIKRPNIDNIIKNSLWYTHIIRNIISKLPFLSVINIKNKIDVVIDIYTKQTDFINEFENWKLFKKNSENALNVIIPHFYEKYCNHELLVMEYLVGHNLLEKKFIGKTENIVMGNLIIGSYLSGIINGFVHGDLHCGNFSWINNNIIIYDFGLMIRLDNNKKNIVLEILSCIFERNSRGLLECFFNYFVDKKHAISDTKKNKLIDKFNNEFYKNGGNLFSDIKRFLENNDLVFNNDMIELELSLLSLLTTLANLCYSLDDGAEIFIDTFNQSILEL